MSSNDFYRANGAVHYAYSANCKEWPCDRMSSVCPSVMLVDQDHIGGKSWKLIAWTISLTPLYVAQSPSTYSQGNMGKFGETRGSVRKNRRS